MTDFMQKQFDISQELIRLMHREHQERTKISEMYEAQIAEKDKTIRKLQATVEALELLVKKT
jgi:phage host-nuclease inhibitor protein Gam